MCNTQADFVNKQTGSCWVFNRGLINMLSGTFQSDRRAPISDSSSAQSPLLWFLTSFHLKWKSETILDSGLQEVVHCCLGGGCLNCFSCELQQRGTVNRMSYSCSTVAEGFYFHSWGFQNADKFQKLITGDDPNSATLSDMQFFFS